MQFPLLVKNPYQNSRESKRGDQRTPAPPEVSSTRSKSIQGFVARCTCPQEHGQLHYG